MELLKPRPLPESKIVLCELKATIRAVDQRTVVCGQILSEGRGQSRLSCKTENSREEGAINSEKAIADFLQASIDFEETQNQKARHTEI